MSRLWIRLTALAAMLLMPAGCGQGPTSPLLIPAATPPPTALPEGEPPTRIFRASPSADHPMGEATLKSRYLLYDAGVFVLEFPAGQFRGTYTATDANLAFVFDFDGFHTAGQPDARVVIDGDTLTVAYNLPMQLSDFEDGRYVRIRQ